MSRTYFRYMMDLGENTMKQARRYVLFWAKFLEIFSYEKLMEIEGIVVSTLTNTVKVGYVEQWNSCDNK